MCGAKNLHFASLRIVGNIFQIFLLHVSLVYTQEYLAVNRVEKKYSSKLKLVFNYGKPKMYNRAHVALDEKQHSLLPKMA